MERLRAAEPRIFVAMLGGGAGTLASFGTQGLAVQARMAERLSMQPMAVPAPTIADHQTEYVMLLALIGSTSSKVVREIYTLMKQQFGEVEEPVPPGTVGSSTMPQKRNPKLSQDIIGAEAQLRMMVPLALESMQTEHEADRSTSLMIGRAMEDACVLSGDILERLRMLMEGIQLFPERMRRNLDRSAGLIMSEALMLELGRTIGRQRAHDVIYDAAQETATGGRPFGELLAEHAAVANALGARRDRGVARPHALRRSVAGARALTGGTRPGRGG